MLREVGFAVRFAVFGFGSALDVNGKISWSQCAWIRHD